MRKPIPSHPIHPFIHPAIHSHPCNLSRVEPHSTRPTTTSTLIPAQILSGWMCFSNQVTQQILDGQVLILFSRSPFPRFCRTSSYLACCHCSPPDGPPTNPTRHLLPVRHTVYPSPAHARAHTHHTTEQSSTYIPLLSFSFPLHPLFAIVRPDRYCLIPRPCPRLRLSLSASPSFAVSHRC